MDEIVETCKNVKTSLNLTRTRTLHRVTAETPEKGQATGENVETAKRRAQTSDNLKRTRTLHRVTAETPENG